MNHKSVKIGIGVVLVVAAFWGYQMFGTATIAVTSEPTGAVVRVDGRQRGVTPVERLELEVGGHRLEVAHSSFKPHVEALSVGRGDHVARHVEMQAGEGTFEFLSNPRGAWVEVDGVRIPGRTPLHYVATSGSHEIVMGDQERRAVAEVHELRHGDTRQVNFDLNMDPHGSVTFKLSPSGAKVEFVGTQIEYKPKVRVPIGEYPVRVSHDGYVAETFRYKVEYADNVHSVNLRRAVGLLRVVAQPAAADITIRYTDADGDHHEKYAGEMRVPTGTVQVRARAMGRRTGLKTIRLDDDGATVQFDLLAISIAVGATVTDSLRSGGKGPELIVVPPGKFLMGDANGPLSERPLREVALTQPFAVSRYEITVGQYLDFASTTGRRVSDKVDRSQTTHPMARIHHKDAAAYADWLSAETGNSYRLLSESEWEYVARAGSQDHYFFGSDPQLLCQYANIADKAVKRSFREWTVVDCDDGMVRPGPVGSFAANPWGLYDIYGNVAEWVLDCSLPDYARAPNDGSPVTSGISCATHGYRGGSWDSNAVETRSSYRNSASQGNDDRGIRVMREL